MARIANILCPVDFSEFSRCALDRAVRIARLHKAVLTAVHVVEPDEPDGDAATSAANARRRRDERSEKMIRFVGAETTLDVQIRREVVEGPSVAREILVQAGRLSADLIVMGTHGRSGVERLLLGSIADKVTRLSHIPVLTVPRSDTEPCGCPPFRTILCAIDFSEASQAALRYVSSLIEEPGSHVMILHVVELLPVVREPCTPSPFDLAPKLADIEAAAHRLVHKTVPPELKACADVEEIVAEGKPYVAILDTATERKADLIVLGAHGPGALDRLRYGSTTSHVVRRASCPVLTVRQAVEVGAPTKEPALTP